MNFREIVEKGRERLDELGIYDLRFKGGAESGATSKINRAFFSTMRFKFNLIDSIHARSNIEVFGCKLKTPVMAAALSAGPVEMKITSSPLVKIAKGVKAAGSLMMVGVSSNEQLKAVVETGVPTVKIIKPYRNHNLIIDKIEDAENVGVKALGIDIDYIIGGKHRDTLFASASQMGLKTQKDLKDFISITKLPFVIKGILSKKDAEKSLKIGAKCLIVSNHGGNVLDYAVHALEVLPEIKELVKTRATLLVDGGFRRGTDVLKALALGADGVLVGRLLLLGLAANLSQGVKDLVVSITNQLQRAMTLTGCKTLADINTYILRRSIIFPTCLRSE